MIIKTKYDIGDTVNQLLYLDNKDLPLEVKGIEYKKELGLFYKLKGYGDALFEDKDLKLVLKKNDD